MPADDQPSAPPPDRRPPLPRWLAAVGVAGILLSWVFATPRHAGPDEPSHAVASAAIVRGQRSGPFAHQPYSAELLTAPAFVGTPNPGCFAFKPDTPASCAGEPVDSTALVPQISRSIEYPIWGHLLPGLASFVPSPTWYAYLARMLAASVPLALVALSLRRLRERGGRWPAIGLLLGLTPIAWSTMSIINPSSMAIAGAVALWTALLTGTPERRGTDWLAVAGWAALVLPRRDGPLWATAIVLVVCAALGRRPRALVRVGPAGSVLVVATAAAALHPVLARDWSAFDLVLALTPLTLVAVDLLVPAGARLVPRRAEPWHVVAAGAAAAALAVGGVNVLRSAGPDLTLTQRIIANTGEHLREWVGVLGWLDTPTPELARVVFWAALGAVVAAGLARPTRALAAAAATFALAIVAAWVLELGSGSTTAQYWQGRYSVPIAIGVPFLAALRTRDLGASSLPTLRTLAVGVWLVWNLSFAGALRRWAVGLNGTINPLRWSVTTAPLPTVAFLAVHALASAALVATVLRWAPEGDRRDGERSVP